MFLTQSSEEKEQRNEDKHTRAWVDDGSSAYNPGSPDDNAIADQELLGRITIFSSATTSKVEHHSRKHSR